MGSSILISLRETHNISRITILNMNKFIVAVALFGAVMGDGGSHHAPAAHDSGYAAPADAYASPAAEYAAPSAYEAPAASYGAPTYEQEYAAPAYEPTSYEASAPAYGAPDDSLDFDLSQLTELLPLFIAELVAPLFGALFGAKVALFGGIFNPLGQLKFDAINAILNPFGFSFASCDGTTGRVCTTINAQFMGRSFSDIGILDMIDAANSLYNAAY